MDKEDEKDTTISSLRSITRGASLYTVGKVVSDAGEFLLHLLVSRILGAGPYGLFAYGKTLAFMGLLLTNLGADKSILRYIPKHDDEPETQRFYLALAWLTSFVGAAVVSGIIIIAAPYIASVTLDEPEFARLLQLFAVVLFVDTLANLLYATFRAVEVIEYEVATKRLLLPVLRVLLVGSALLVGASVFGVVVALVLASILTLVVAVVLLVTRLDIHPQIRSSAADKQRVKQYYNYSLPLTAKEAGTAMQGRIDVLIVGLFFSSAAVGIYNVSVLIAGILYIPLLAFNQLFPPVASRLYSNNDRKELATIYSAITRWIFTISLPIALIITVYRTELLSLFGPEFTAGTAILAVFVFAQLCNCLTGPSGYLLMMTDHQYVVMINEWVFGIANIILNILFLYVFGLIGAALASAAVLAVRNITKVSEVYYFEQLQPYSRSFIRPMLAGIPAAVGMMLLQAFLPTVWSLIIGIPLGVGLFVLGLYTAGISSVDRQLYRQLRNSG